jgi:hypothetical protein
VSRRRNPVLDRYAELYKKGFSCGKIAEMMDTTRQSVHEALKVRGVKLRPGRKAIGTIIVYKGDRYTWCTKGFWRCTRYTDRHNLTHRIWDEHRGPVPDGHVVYFKDGDRFNVIIKNLGCVTRRKRQLDRLKDPYIKAAAMAGVVYGQLTRIIADQQDPSRRANAMRKAWETRRKRYGANGGTKSGPEHHHYGKKFSSMARARMSLAQLSRGRGDVT